MASTMLKKKIRVLQVLKDQGVKSDKDLQNLEWEKLIDIPGIRLDDLRLIKELKMKVNKAQLFNFLMSDEGSEQIIRKTRKKNEDQLQLADDGTVKEPSESPNKAVETQDSEIPADAAEEPLQGVLEPSEEQPAEEDDLPTPAVNPFTEGTDEQAQDEPAEWNG